MPFESWTPSEKAGQHITAGFEGIEAPASLLERIRGGRVGGVILFGRNIESAKQTLKLTRSLQEAAGASRHRTPLLISIDQEGGRVSRLSPDFTIFPEARAFGDSRDPGLALEAAQATARELRAVGVNVDFAPVLDILTNPACSVIGDRAFGTEPRVAAERGEAVISGLQTEGVAACAKHFPGIGDMAPDPHETLPECGLSLDDLNQRELVPFANALASELPGGRPAAVMVAHAVYSQIDPDAPASLSPVLIGGLLRASMGFHGVVFTDDLEMGAIDNPPAAALSSLRAGADVALICHSESIQEAAHKKIAEAFEGGALSEEKENTSLQRIMALKSSFASLAASDKDPPPASTALDERLAIVGCDAHKKILDKVRNLRENPESS